MPSPRAQRIAESQERDRASIERLARRQFIPVGRAIVSDVLAAWTRRRSPWSQARLSMLRIVPIVAAGMTAAHLKGILRSELLAAARLVGRRKALATVTSVLGGALEVLRERSKMTDEQLRALRARYTNLAFAAVEPAAAQVERRLQRTVGQVLKDGLTVRDAIPVLQGAMRRSGLSPAKPYVAEAIFRTQVQLAYSAGRQLRNQDPAIQEILWGYEYVTVGDDRVRPTHRALEGTKLPKDDPLWNSIMPPNGYNCRCSVVEIFDEGETEPPPDSIEVDGEHVAVEPDPGFDFNPAELVNPEIAVPPGQLFESAIDVERQVVTAAKAEEQQVVKLISPRDAEVVAALRRGDMARRVARDLGVPEATVRRVAEARGHAIVELPLDRSTRQSDDQRRDESSRRQTPVQEGIRDLTARGSVTTRATTSGAGEQNERDPREVEASLQRLAPSGSTVQQSPSGWIISHPDGTQTPVHFIDTLAHLSEEAFAASLVEHHAGVQLKTARGAVTIPGTVEAYMRLPKRIREAIRDETVFEASYMPDSREINISRFTRGNAPIDEIVREEIFHAAFDRLSDREKQILLDWAEAEDPHQAEEALYAIYRRLPDQPFAGEPEAFDIIRMLRRGDVFRPKP